MSDNLIRQTWVEVSVRVPRALAAVVEKELEELGSAGCAEDTLGAKGEVAESPLIKGYFLGSIESVGGAVDTFREFISSISDIFPAGHIGAVEVRETSEEEWQRWKEFFKPLKVSKRVVIKPSWEPYERKGDEIVVEIDPGMAFGTGTHETTKLCCALLDKVIEGGERVLDVGTGTGILAIAAAKLGAGRVLAIDIDERSLEISAGNVGKNGVSHVVEVSAKRLENVKERYGLVVANILAEDLIEMRDDITARLEGGGDVILSGILISKADMVVDAYRGAGMKLKARIEEGEWSALLMGS